MGMIVNRKRYILLAIIMMICYVLVPVYLMWRSLPADALSGMVFGFLFMAVAGIGLGIVCGSWEHPFVMSIIGITFMVIGGLWASGYSLWLLVFPGGVFVASVLFSFGAKKNNERKEGRNI